MLQKEETHADARCKIELLCGEFMLMKQQTASKPLVIPYIGDRLYRVSADIGGDSIHLGYVDSKISAIAFAVRFQEEHPAYDVSFKSEEIDLALMRSTGDIAVKELEKFTLKENES